MRRDTYRANPDTERLNRFTLDRAAAATLAGGVFAYVLVLLSGALASPLLPLVALWIFVAAIDRRTSAAAWALAGAAGLALLAGELALDTLAWRDGAALTAVLGAGLLPALLWRTRTARDADRLTQLDRILTETESRERTAEGVAVQQLRDLEAALHELAGRVNALRVVLWRVDLPAGLARPWASSGGPLPTAPVPLRGSPLGWTWEEGMQIRLEPAPNWAAANSQVCAARLRREGADGALVTYEFDAAVEPPSSALLDGAASYVRAILGAHDQQSAAAGDRRRLNLLMRTLRGMPVEPDLEAVGRAILEAALDLVDGTGGAVAVWDDDSGRILSVAGSDGGPEPGTTFVPAECEMAIAARARSAIVRQSRSRAATPVGSAKERWTHPPRALAAVPLTTPSGVIGILALWNSKTPSFDEAALELVHAAAPYLALVLNHAREYGRVRDDADHDPLTGLHNRRAFERELAAERTRFERYNRPLALLLIDLDHFKRVNDTHGHEAGDAVLQQVADTIREEVRDVDIPARLGGEEFVVLLPETVLAHALEVAERLRDAFERLEFTWQGTAVPLRASIGVSACPSCVPDPRALVRSADAALYVAKSMGRNRVVAADRRL